MDVVDNILGNHEDEELEEMYDDMKYAGHSSKRKLRKRISGLKIKRW